MTDSEQVLAEMTIRWTLPPPTRLPSRVRECLVGIYGDMLEPDEANRLEMASHELLENVLKYSSEGMSSFDVAISEEGGRGRVCIRTRNLAAPEQIGTLQRLVERIGSTLDPVAVYDDLIATSHSRPGSGLGLARIRAEAEMKLTCSAEGRQITIVAERPVSIRRESC